MWLGNEESLKSTFDPEAFVDDEISAEDLSVDVILEHGIRLNHYLHGDDIIQQLERVCHFALEKAPDEGRLNFINDAISHFLTASSNNQESTMSGDEFLETTVEPISNTLWSSVSRLLDKPAVRLSGARSVHNVIQDRLDQIQKSIGDLTDHTISKLHDLRFDPTGNLDRQFTEISTLRATESALRWSEKLVTRIKRSNKELLRQIEDVQSFLESTLTVATSGNQKTSSRIDGPDFGAVISESLSNNLANHVMTLENFVEEKFLGQSGGLRAVVESDPVNGVTQLAHAIQVETRNHVAKTYRNINFDEIIDTAQPDNQALRVSLKKYMEESFPRLMDCGGAIRLFLGVPPKTKGQRLSNHMEFLNGRPTLIRGTDGDIVICVEGENVSSENAALKILEECPEATEFIERIASRLDVEWRPLTGLG